MNPYRTHTCEVLRPEHIGQTVRLAGWVHRKRDHGNLLFIDLRDHYGLTQCVVTPEFGRVSRRRSAAERERHQRRRPRGRTRPTRTSNPALPTGFIEVDVDAIDVLSAADTLPFQVAGTQEIPEEQRLRYRFLDLAPREDSRQRRAAVDA